MPRKKQQPLENLPAKWEKRAARHARAGELLCELVIKKLEVIAASEEDVSPYTLRTLAETLNHAAAIEKDALLMQYRDSNVAIQRVQQLGFLVQRPDGAIEVDATVIE